MSSKAYPQNVYLVGMMGAGKTKVGKVLAKRLGFEFVDIDRLIEKEQGMSINDIFTGLGEEGFRDFETEVLLEVSRASEQVVSTGGGVVIREKNRSRIRDTGFSVYLSAPVEVLWKRISEDKGRPLLMVDDPLGVLNAIFKERSELYLQADIVVDTEHLDSDGVAGEIIKQLDQMR